MNVFFLHDNAVRYRPGIWLQGSQILWPCFVERMNLTKLSFFGNLNSLVFTVILLLLERVIVFVRVTLEEGPCLARFAIFKIFELNNFLFVSY